MAGLVTGRRVTCILAGLVVLWGSVDRAEALDAFDKRIEAHGFVEIQARGLNRSYAEEFDLAQWYNVLNVEVELDILPDGWGFIDLLQAYIRGEARYDCIYSAGCGTFPSINTYGNRSRDLPMRLRDGLDYDYGGVVDTADFADPPGVIPLINPRSRNPVSWSVSSIVKTERGDDIEDPNTYTEPFPTTPHPHPCPTTHLTGPNASDALGPNKAGCIDNRPTHTEITKREGFPGFDTLFDGEGADGELGPFQDYASMNALISGAFGRLWYDPSSQEEGFVPPSPAPGTPFLADYGSVFRGLAYERDDPAAYTLNPVLSWKFAFRSVPGPVPSGRTLPMGPWLPKNFFNPIGALGDRAHPLRGRDIPNLLVVNDQIGGPDDVRRQRQRINELDCRPGSPYYPCAGKQVDPVDQRLTNLEQLSINLGLTGHKLRDPDGAGHTLELLAYPRNDLFKGVLGDRPFGGDYSGIIPCYNPEKVIGNRKLVSGQDSKFIKQLSSDPAGAGGTYARRGCIPLTNIRVTGGEGELPLRPAPDYSNLAVFDSSRAQGLYIPSWGLVHYKESGGEFDNHEFNINQTDRSWNRGASQQDTYELKEAYLDMEFLESRLWIRAGIQNIVWGKTELFRTTDQFNPQDFALASLPSLEEGRIALLSWRGVYSFYDVGPLEDLRFEFAMNFDRNKPVDLGACGEPYTLDIVCGLTFGTAIHGVTGLGVAGFDRPPTGWEDVDGLEFGGRLEFRWDRFSFAIVDFYGYSDFPYPDVITYFERNVDPGTGNPRKGGARGNCANRGAFVATQVFAPDDVKLLHGGNYRLEVEAQGLLKEAIAGGDPGQISMAEAALDAVQPTGLKNVTIFKQGTGEVSSANKPGSARDDWWRNKAAYTLMGIGTDDSCLKPGGAPGLLNENRFDSDLAPSSDEFFKDNSLSDYSDPGSTTPVPGGPCLFGICLPPGDLFKMNTYVARTVGNTAPVLNSDGVLQNTKIQWTKAGSSVDYALLHHPANQQLFSFICSGTVTIAVSLSPTACAWNLWGTDARLFGDLAGASFGDAMSGAFAGNKTKEGYYRFYETVLQFTKGSGMGESVFVLPITPLNSDVRDGRTGSVDGYFGTNGINFVGPVGFQDVRKKDMARDEYDLLTLDNTLTVQQKATLGCGPAFGTRCDSGTSVVRVRIKDCGPLSPADPRKKICDRYAAAGLIGQLDIESERDAKANTLLYDIVTAPTDPNDPMTAVKCFLDTDPCRIWGRGGGIDFQMMEGSVILQSMPGIEGTGGRTQTKEFDFGDTWLTWAADTPQPGTIGLFGLKNVTVAGETIDDRPAGPSIGGAICTRYAPSSPLADKFGLVTLPGCRGAISATIDGGAPANPFDNVIKVQFDRGYSPAVDGCTFGRKMNGQDTNGITGAGEDYWVVAYTDGEYDADLQDELYETCFNDPYAPNIDGVDPIAHPDFIKGTEQKENKHIRDWTWFSYTRGPNVDEVSKNAQLSYGAGHLFHPTAQCEQAGPGIKRSLSDTARVIWNLQPDPNIPGGGTPEQQVAYSEALCQSAFRDFENDSLHGNAQVFRNELAAISWNFAMFLAITSCNSVTGGDDLSEKDCFDPKRPWKGGGCSLSAMQYCRNLKGFLGVGGIGRNDPRAGGNPSFGRRDFIWHSGAELVLKYAQRNVFGFSADFAEDNTKTNWGLEFTWIGATPWVDNNSYNSTTNSDVFNLTVSVDRPTFINFLNANRTFFFNTQWFFNYIPRHSNGFTSFADPFNVLFTFAVFTGYYQDRLLPQLVTVYDFGSQSGGFLPQIGYRFTEAFSMTFGVSFFIGKNEYLPMAVRGFAPRANRAGPHKYDDGVNRLLANLMRRDEAWLRVRWTF